MSENIGIPITSRKQKRGVLQNRMSDMRNFPLLDDIRIQR